MSFMQPHIDAKKKTWILFEGPNGDSGWAESSTDVPEGWVETQRMEGFAYYLSAPGYLDKTDTEVAETQVEAAWDLLETYYNNELEEEENEEAKELLQFIREMGTDEDQAKIAQFWEE